MGEVQLIAPVVLEVVEPVNGGIAEIEVELSCDLVEEDASTLRRIALARS